MLDAIDSIKNINVIFTKANADPDGCIINRMIDQYVKATGKNAIAFTSMGQLRYLSAMKHAAAVVGNSSSGIMETPSLALPTVKIGIRQEGRELLSQSLERALKTIDAELSERAEDEDLSDEESDSVRELLLRVGRSEAA